MDQMIQTSISNFTVSGIENLDTDSKYKMLDGIFDEILENPLLDTNKDELVKSYIK